MKADGTLETARLRIRPWRDTTADRSFFHRINHDEQVMRFYPWRQTREEADEKLDQIRARAAEVGFGWAVAEMRDSGKPVGFTGLSRLGADSIAAGAVEIGWRYVPESWGNGLASEAARALLAHGFDELGLDRIIAFAVDSNQASIAVMQRIGMTARPELDFDHPGVPDTHPQLRHHVFYEMFARDPRP